MGPYVQFFDADTRIRPCGCCISLITELIYCILGTLAMVIGTYTRESDMIGKIFKQHQHIVIKRGTFEIVRVTDNVKKSSCSSM